MENKIYLTIEQGVGTDGEPFFECHLNRTAQEAGEFACFLMASMAEKMGVYTDDFDPTATWEIEGEGWWYKVSWLDAGVDPHSPSRYLTENAKDLFRTSRKGFANNEDLSSFAKHASDFIEQFMEEYLPDALELEKLQILPDNVLKTQLGKTQTMICKCGHPNENAVLYPYGYNNDEQKVMFVSKCKKCNALMFERQRI